MYAGKDTLDKPLPSNPFELSEDSDDGKQQARSKDDIEMNALGSKEKSDYQTYTVDTGTKKSLNILNPFLPANPFSNDYAPS